VSFWVYILKCSDDSYYTGHTEDLEVRFAQHQRGSLPCHTRSRRPATLMWSEAFDTRYEALEAERRIKGWSRAKKEALIAGDWERLSLLARNRQAVSRPSTSSGQTE
jgi:predicted GIY-YIG superfamily endonuclease